MENKKAITVEASMENLDKVTSFVEAFLDDYACPMKIAMKILLCKCQNIRKSCHLKYFHHIANHILYDHGSA